MRDPRRDQTMINDRIRFPQVRLIDEHNAQLGVMQTRDALDLARDRGLDLILVAPQAQPPVCRIMDYGKFKYEKSKREKIAHKKGAASEMKMVRLHPPTGEHDRAILIRHAERFLREGHKVRVVCQFRRRENAYPELGRQQLDTVAKALADIATVEGTIIKQGRDMTMNLAPRPGVKPLPKPVKEKKGGREDQVVEDVDEDAEFEAFQQSIIDEDAEDDHAAVNGSAPDDVAANGT
ncbi:MAG: translation initiation factor IF-3 [Abitibacteriaceae bacterium]|nr:translation initiation factor IF-3 [Abditibacteriaceae bacterium]